MWAAEKRLVNAISPYCPILEQTEAKELLGSALVCVPNGSHDFDQAFRCFSQAIELRLTHHLSKGLRTSTMEMFDHRQEFQTPEELETIRYSFTSMNAEALLIRERLLGLANPRFRASVTYCGAFLIDSGQHHQALPLWMYELGLCQQYSLELDLVQLQEIVSLVSEMLSQSTSVSVDSALTLLSSIGVALERDKNKFDHNVSTLLFLITIITSSQFSMGERRFSHPKRLPVGRLLRKFIRFIVRF